MGNETGDYTDAVAVLSEMEERYSGSNIPHALRSTLLITVENGKDEARRNYDAAYEQFREAERKITGSDDTTYFRQVESLINELLVKGWL